MVEKFKTSRPFASYKRTEFDIPVKGGLSVTPSEMMRMASQGIPISNANLPFVDGDKNPSWNIPAENVRGIDVAELWTLQQDSKAKIVKAHLSDVTKFD